MAPSSILPGWIAPTATRDAAAQPIPGYQGHAANRTGLLATSDATNPLGHTVEALSPVKIKATEAASPATQFVHSHLRMEQAAGRKSVMPSWQLTSLKGNEPYACDYLTTTMTGPGSFAPDSMASRIARRRLAGRVGAEQ